jgi:hypothetical protein
MKWGTQRLPLPGICLQEILCLTCRLLPAVSESPK